MKQAIHIYGASGSGTSTLGKKISEELGYRFLDSDDYFWLPTDPRFIKVRNIDGGGVEMRSKANHNEWQKLLKCRQIVLNGANSVDCNFEMMLKEINISDQVSGGLAL